MKQFNAKMHIRNEICTLMLQTCNKCIVNFKQVAPHELVWNIPAVFVEFLTFRNQNMLKADVSGHVIQLLSPPKSILSSKLMSGQFYHLNWILVINGSLAFIPTSQRSGYENEKLGLAKLSPNIVCYTR